MYLYKKLRPEGKDISVFVLWVEWMVLLFPIMISNHLVQVSTLRRLYLCQTNHNTTSLVPLHRHLQSVSKSICHGNCHCKDCGKACLTAIKVVINFIIILCLFVIMWLLIEITGPWIEDLIYGLISMGMAQVLMIQNPVVLA
jgi:hypothetical protein